MGGREIVKCNGDPGLSIKGKTGERMLWLRCDVEGSTVNLRVDYDRGGGAGIDDVLQYLSPLEAMAFGISLQKCAQLALMHEADAISA